MNTVAELLGDLLNPGWTPAKAAKNRASIDAAADSGPCEGLRKSANPQPGGEPRPRPRARAPRPSAPMADAMATTRRRRPARRS